MTTSWDDAVLDPDTPAGADGVTLGLAVAVPEPWAGELVERRAATGDPVARSVPPHVTLVPPLVVAPGQVEAVAAHVRERAAGCEPFVLHLAGAGTFRPVSQVSFVRVAAGATECDALQSRLRCGPLARELRFPYHPHVTVGHDVPDAALDRAERDLAGFEARFTVEHVSLFRCDADGVWRVVSLAPLAADGGAGAACRGA
ncbi:2'-5' RNA ligase family protein [Aquipuribacter sp. SD81]|uniref:2'-5' RNA ligase family protein n=1 Tax=Aquipuribacter sp. SD81 TaxID=3127703 RepID=UPI00301976E2